MWERFITVKNNRFIRLLGVAIIAGLISGSASAQEAKLNIGQLDKLAAKAAETVDVNLDEKLLQLASRFINSNNPQEASIKELIAGLKGVYVRVFEFDKPGDYAPADLEAIRSQLRAPGWTKIVGVISRREGQNVDVHLNMQGNNVVGLAIIASEPRELTLVNIVGPIDLEKLSRLQGQFGIPKLDLEQGGKEKKRN